jgi:hypothetical protein
MMNVQSCPDCGASRFKRAPLLLLAILEPLVRLRRYRCTRCGRASWKPRLEREVKPPPLGPTSSW